MKSLRATYFGNPLWAWMAGVLVSAVSISAVAVIKHFLKKRLEDAGDTSGFQGRS